MIWRHKLLEPHLILRSVHWDKPVGNAEPQGIRRGVMCVKALKEDECSISVHERLGGQGWMQAGLYSNKVARKNINKYKNLRFL